MVARRWQRRDGCGVVQDNIDAPSAARLKIKLHNTAFALCHAADLHRLRNSGVCSGERSLPRPEHGLALLPHPIVSTDTQVHCRMHAGTSQWQGLVRQLHVHRPFPHASALHRCRPLRPAAADITGGSLRRQHRCPVSRRVTRHCVIESHDSRDGVSTDPQGAAD